MIKLVITISDSHFIRTAVFIILSNNHVDVGSRNKCKRRYRIVRASALLLFHYYIYRYPVMMPFGSMVFFRLSEPTPPSPSPPPSPTLDDLLDDFTPNELQEISEDAHDDEAERVIARYRRQRVAEIQAAEKKARFGRVYPIGREDYTREVTEASMVDEDDDTKELGTGVVCFLYKDG